MATLHRESTTLSDSVTLPLQSSASLNHDEPFLVFSSVCCVQCWYVDVNLMMPLFISKHSQQTTHIITKVYYFILQEMYTRYLFRGGNTALRLTITFVQF